MRLDHLSSMRFETMLLLSSCHPMSSHVIPSRRFLQLVEVVWPDAWWGHLSPQACQLLRRLPRCEHSRAVVQCQTTIPGLFTHWRAQSTDMTQHRFGLMNGTSRVCDINCWILPQRNTTLFCFNINRHASTTLTDLAAQNP